MAYLMAAEADEHREGLIAKLEAEFKNALFIHDRPLYMSVFGDELGPDEEQIEYVVPDSPEDLEDLAAALGLEIPDD